MQVVVSLRIQIAVILYSKMMDTFRERARECVKRHGLVTEHFFMNKNIFSTCRTRSYSLKGSTHLEKVQYTFL